MNRKHNIEGMIPSINLNTELRPKPLRKKGTYFRIDGFIGFDADKTHDEVWDLLIDFVESIGGHFGGKTYIMTEEELLNE